MNKLPVVAHPEQDNPKTTYQYLFSAFLLTFIGVLSVSGTIALRNILHVALLAMIAWHFFSGERNCRDQTYKILKAVPLPLHAWVFFLCVFPWFAVQADVAWINFRGQWGESILTWALAAGALMVLGRHAPSLWVLALAGAAPVLLHLSLCLLAWGGYLSPAFYDEPSLVNLWQSLPEFFRLHGSLVPLMQPFPWGFRGIEPMHGNIGYAATQSTLLSCVCACAAWQASNRKMLVYSALLIIACLFSVVVAAARGSVYFGMLGIGAAFLLYSLKGQLNAQRRRTFLLAVASSLAMIFGLVYLVASNNVRWYSMVDKIAVGWAVPNPVSSLCNGLSDRDIQIIHKTYEDREPGYSQELILGLQGQDGGRILLMRAGAQLVADNFNGLDGSRQSYQKLITAKCTHPPVLEFAHAHQAWINLALALGWLGAALFLWLLLTFMTKGWVWSADQTKWPWAMAMCLVAAFWVLRGFTDAVYQEHYLQMQAFLLLYLYLRASPANIGLNSGNLRASA